MNGNILDKCFPGPGWKPTPTNDNCECASKYHLAYNVQLDRDDCMPDCESPCLICVDGSSKKC